jgi:propanol-preferring alcohol dehydrogenase
MFIGIFQIDPEKVLVMRAMQLRSPRSLLEMADLDMPRVGPGQLLVKVHACGVCRTDLHVVDRDLPNAKSPIVPGHEVVGTVAQIGGGVAGFREGDRVGIPWLGFTCGKCRYCRTGRENLCDGARFTGYDIDGGYADYTVADSRYCFLLPAPYSDLEAAPLLCAGLIGYRALRMAGEAERLGIYGFGAAAHIVAQVARHQGREVFAFTRPGDIQAQQFARDLGAVWAGDSDTPPPNRSMRRCCSPPSAVWFP